MSDPAPLEVFVDGSCPLCQWSQARIEPRDRNRRLHFLDYNNPACLQRAAPRTPEELSQQIHVRHPDGHWSSGFLAWISILKVLPRWRWVGALLSIPPMNWVGPILYRWMARHRYYLLKRSSTAPPHTSPHKHSNRSKGDAD